MDAHGKCDAHNGGRMNMVCKTCNGVNICMRCIAESHKNHNVVPYKLPHGVESSNKCKIHGRPYIKACLTCKKQLLCWNCLVPKHTNHVTLDYDDFVQRQQKRIQRWHKENYEMEKGGAKVDVVMYQINKRRDELKDEIVATADKLLTDYETHIRKYYTKRHCIWFNLSKVREKQVEAIFGQLIK